MRTSIAFFIIMLASFFKDAQPDSSNRSFNTDILDSYNKNFLAEQIQFVWTAPWRHHWISRKHHHVASSWYICQQMELRSGSQSGWSHHNRTLAPNNIIASCIWMLFLFVPCNNNHNDIPAIVYILNHNLVFFIFPSYHTQNEKILPPKLLKIGIPHVYEEKFII